MNIVDADLPRAAEVVIVDVGQRRATIWFPRGLLRLAKLCPDGGIGRHADLELVDLRLIDDRSGITARIQGRRREVQAGARQAEHARGREERPGQAQAQCGRR